MNAEMLAPQPANLTKSQISGFAEEVARSFAFAPGSSLKALVEQLGGRIKFQDIWDLEQSESGSIVINKPGEFEITLASHTSAARDRFTIAHELGHYFLHYLLPYSGDPEASPGSMRATRYGHGRTELEANWFAASFLMPEAQFREAFESSGGDVLELASSFKVSESAARVRAQSLGLM